MVPCKALFVCAVQFMSIMTTTAQLTVIAEGDPIRLNCSDMFQERRRMRWYTGSPPQNGDPSYQPILQYNYFSGDWVTRITAGTRYTMRINHSTQGVCVINQSKKDDDTQYFCDVFVLPDPIKRPFTFKIIAKPTQPPTVTPGPTARSQEGTYIQLTCQLQEDTGEPYNYSWSRSSGEVRGQVDPTRGTLTFTSTLFGDQDNYTCRASNRAGNTEASVQLFVDSPPTTFGITTYTTGDILYSGDNKEMICRTDGGRPLPTLFMNCVGQTGTHGGTGNIRTINFTAEVQPTWHNKNCVCTATQQISTMTQTRSVTFTVYYPPASQNLTLVDSPWLENTVSRAQCHVTRGNPTSTFKWYKGQGTEPIRTGTAEQVHELQYTFVKEDNGISLACTVENQYTIDKETTPATAQVTLNVEYHPRVTLRPGDTIIRKENDPLTLTCTADSNPTAVNNNDFQWTKGESLLPPGPKVQISSVKKTDSGVYKCTVTVHRAYNKGALSGSAQTMVDIQYFHLISGNDQEVTENDNLILNCTVDSNPSSFKFNKWTHINGGKERELSSTSIEDNVAYLDLSPVDYTTGGMYKCEAGNNVYPNVTAQQNIIVFYTPKSDTHSATGEIRYAALRSSVPFGVVVHAYPSAITFTWRALVNESVWQVLSDDDKYSITNTVTSSSLVVRNVSVADYTKYVLNATNNIRNGASFSFTLMPRDKPGEPIIVSEDSFSTAVSITLTWRSNFNGGYNQTFSIKMKESSQKDYTEMEKDIPDPGLGEKVTRMFTKLKSLTLYQFKVIAHNEHMNGSSSESGTDIETKEAPVIRNTSLIVVREADHAHLQWEPPLGEYEWQIIEQREISKRERRSTCGPPGCTQHNYTKHTNNATVFAPQEKKYSFQLVLYDKGVEVGRSGNFEEEVIAVRPSDGPSLAAIAGGTVGGLVAVVVLILITVVLLRRKRLSENQEKEKLRNESLDVPPVGTNAAYVHDEQTEGNGAYADVNQGSVSNGRTNKKKKQGTVETGNALATNNDPNALYAQPEKKGKKKTKQVADSEATGAMALYAQPEKKKKDKDEAFLLHSQPQKKKKDKQESVRPQEMVYAEVNKKNKQATSNESTGPDQQGVLYAAVEKKQKPQKKEKPKKNEKKKKAAKSGPGDTYENVNQVYENVKGAKNNTGESEYADVETGQHFSNAPPGSEGLQYAAVEFVRKRSDKSAVKPIQEDMTEYAAIDYKRKAAPTEGDKGNDN